MFFTVRIMLRTTHYTTYISQYSSVTCILIAVELHTKNADHQIHYSLFNTVENYDIIHFRAIDFSSYITS